MNYFIAYFVIGLIWSQWSARWAGRKFPIVKNLSGSTLLLMIALETIACPIGIVGHLVLRRKLRC